MATTPTKAEIEEQNAELQRQLEEQRKINEQLQAQVEQGTTQRRQMLAKGEGWLVIAPVPTFNERLLGVQFTDGMTFIRKAQHVETMELPREKDTRIVQFLKAQYPDPAYDEAFRQAELKRIKERQNTPSSERAAMAFMNDWGFQVEWYGAERLEELQDRMSARAIERQQAESMQADLRNAQQMMVPGYRGG